MKGKSVSVSILVALMLMATSSVASAADCGLLGWIIGCDPLMAGTQQEAMQQETARYTADVNAAAAIRQAELQAQADLNAAQWNTTALIQTSNNSVAIEALRNQTSANNAQSMGMLAAAIVVAAGMMGGAYVFAGRRRPDVEYAPQPARVLPTSRPAQQPALDVESAFAQICWEEGVRRRTRNGKTEVWNQETKAWMIVPRSKMLTLAQDKGLM